MCRAPHLESNDVTPSRKVGLDRRKITVLGLISIDQGQGIIPVILQRIFRVADHVIVNVFVGRPRQVVDFDFSRVWRVVR
jgi:hypothetical protein